MIIDDGLLFVINRDRKTIQKRGEMYGQHINSCFDGYGSSSIIRNTGSFNDANSRMTSF